MTVKAQLLQGYGGGGQGVSSLPTYHVRPGDMGLQYEFLADPATIIISCAVFMVCVLHYIHNTTPLFSSGW